MKDVEILIVDDEEDICEILAKIMQKQGYATHTVNSAEETEAFLNSQIPPLIFCDISMPGKSGLELLQEIRMKGIASAVVMLTAHSEKERIIEALRLGAVDYVQKPFDTEKLLAAIPVWLELGARLQRLETDEFSKADVERQMKLIDLIKVKGNLDRKKTG